MILATYNIHRCVGRDGQHDPDRVCAVLRECHADVVALQEVESLRNGGLDQLQHIAMETGMRPLAGPTILNPAAHYGNALLTRFDIVAKRHVDLSVTGHEPRGALDVDIAHDGKIVHVVATHLGLRPAERRAQIKRLLQLFHSGTVSSPAVLMGDLNEWFLWGRPVRWLHAHFAETPAPATFPTRFPLFALDRIWVSPRTALQSVYVHASRLARVASDHLPLCATVDC